MQTNKRTFIDFGCGRGGAMEGYSIIMNATPVLGIDTWEEHLEEARAKGYPVMNADITQLTADELPRVTFSTFIHVLEHMPDLETVAKVIALACEVSSDFVYIRQPYFDADEYLAERGLKFNWSNWSCHPSHVTSDQFRQIAAQLGYHAEISYRTHVPFSSDPNLLPLDAPFETGIFNQDMGFEKPDVQLSNVFHETVCIIRLREYSDKEWNDLLSRLQ